MAEVERGKRTESRGHRGGDRRNQARRPTDTSGPIGARDGEDGHDDRQDAGADDRSRTREPVEERDGEGDERGRRERSCEDSSHRVLTRSRMSAKTRGVTSPRVCSSSTFVNVFAFRERTMRAAVVAPTPGSVWSSAALA